MASPGAKTNLFVKKKNVGGRDTGKVEKTLVIPDLVGLMATHQEPGDIVVLPVQISGQEGNRLAMWEQGGRHPDYNSAVGTVIAGPGNKLITAITVNRGDSHPGGRQALMPVISGGRVYVGKLSVPNNSLNMKAKVFELSLVGDIEKPTDEMERNIGYAKFKVERMYRSYGDAKDNRPVQCLLSKLFDKKATRPAFANGWTMVNDISGVDLTWAEVIARNTSGKTVTAEEGVKIVEQFMSGLDQKGMCMALQVFDLKKSVVTIIPVAGADPNKLKEIDPANVTVGDAVTMNISELIDHTNRFVGMDVDSVNTLEMVVSKDDDGSLSRKIAPSIYMFVRGWKG